jgi:subtilisin-like proprotein convertase family protein
MKLIATAAVAAVSLATVASADVFSNDYNIEWPTDQTGEILSAPISLPGVATIDSISLDIAHTWGNDLLITLTSPTGDVFDLMNDEVDQGGSGNFDMGLIAADGSLANVATYNFVEAGGLDVWDDTSGVAPGGTYNANSWASTGWDAGDWTLSVSDLVGGDGGAIGNVTIMYTIPAPGALALLGLAGLAGRRRRNG